MKSDLTITVRYKTHAGLLSLYDRLTDLAPKAFTTRPSVDSLCVDITFSDIETRDRVVRELITRKLMSL